MFFILHRTAWNMVGTAWNMVERMQCNTIIEYLQITKGFIVLVLFLIFINDKPDIAMKQDSF